MFNIKNNPFHNFRYKFLFIFILLLQSCNTSGSLQKISDNLSLPSISTNSFTKSFSLPKVSIPSFKSKCTTLCNSKFVKEATLDDYKKYLDNNHSFNSVDKSNGWTPLMYLLKYSNNEKLILFAFANSNDLDIKSNSGTYPLHIAAQHQSLDIFNELRKLVKNKNPKTQKGMPLIHFAAQNKSYDIIAQLIEGGEDINQDFNGWTPLSYAALNGSSILIDKLISLGANKDKAQVNDWNNYSNWVYPDIPPYSTTIANKETKFNLTTSKNTFYTPGNTTHIADYSLNKFKNIVFSEFNILLFGIIIFLSTPSGFSQNQISEDFSTTSLELENPTSIEENYTRPVYEKTFDRSQLPQIKRKHLVGSEFKYKEGTMSIDKIKPVQTQRVDGLAKKSQDVFLNNEDKPFIVDKNGYLINGHHRFDAANVLGIKKVKTIMVDADIEDVMKAFDHTTSDRAVMAENYFKDLLKSKLLKK